MESPPNNQSLLIELPHLVTSHRSPAQGTILNGLGLLFGRSGIYAVSGEHASITRFVDLWAPRIGNVSGSIIYVKRDVLVLGLYAKGAPKAGQYIASPETHLPFFRSFLRGTRASMKDAVPSTGPPPLSYFNSRSSVLSAQRKCSTPGAAPGALSSIPSWYSPLVHSPLVLFPGMRQHRDTATLCASPRISRSRTSWTASCEHTLLIALVELGQVIRPETDVRPEKGAYGPSKNEIALAGRSAVYDGILNGCDTLISHFRAVELGSRWTNCKTMFVLNHKDLLGKGFLRRRDCLWMSSFLFSYYRYLLLCSDVEDCRIDHVCVRNVSSVTAGSAP